MADGVAALCRVDPGEIALHIVSAIRNPQAWATRIAEGRRRSASFRTASVVESYIALYDALLQVARHGTSEKEEWTPLPPDDVASHVLGKARPGGDR